MTDFSKPSCLRFRFCFRWDIHFCNEIYLETIFQLNYLNVHKSCYQVVVFLWTAVKCIATVGDIFTGHKFFLISDAHV